MSELLKDTVEKENYLRSCGFRVESVWECHWEREVDARPEIKAFLGAFFRTLYPRRGPASLAAMVSKIRSGEFDRLVECDIHVPDEMRDKFSEMGPIFKNVDVRREHLSECMRKIAVDEHRLTAPRRMLVGSLKG